MTLRLILIDFSIGSNFSWKVFTLKVVKGEDGQVGLEIKMDEVLNGTSTLSKTGTHEILVTCPSKNSNKVSFESFDENLKRF